MATETVDVNSLYNAVQRLIENTVPQDKRDEYYADLDGYDDVEEWRKDAEANAEKEAEKEGA